MGKIVTLNKAVKIRQKIRENGEKVVFTNGCFDILHKGHIFYLKESAKLGDYLFVGINSDSSVKILKGENRPIFSEMERAEILSSLEFVDYVTIFDEETPLNLIKNILPDVLVKGGDYKLKDIVGDDCVRENGGVVMTIPFLEGFSTSEILKKIGK